MKSNVEQTISEYLHALTTLRLASALDNRPVYVRAVAKRVAANLDDKESRAIFKSIAKSHLPANTVHRLMHSMSIAYAEQGYDWKEQA